MRTFTCSRRSGFTLIELMVALAIAGILAAIAYPAYTSQMQRSRRSDALTALTAVMQAQERYRSNASSYASSWADLKLDNPNYYEVSLSGLPGGAGTGFESGYVATATPVVGGRQASDITCKTLTVTLKGASPKYTATGDPAQTGTDKDTTNDCWPK